MQSSFIIPTRDRANELDRTIQQLGDLDPQLIGQCELIVVDNASSQTVKLPDVLSNGIEVHTVRSEQNLHTAARNLAAERARGRWLIMLDDDSSLMPCELRQYLDSLDLSVAAVGGEIWLPDGRHESGGLPEVVVGCGCAIRREAFLGVGGYDKSFGYYAEEYDLCAKLLFKGYQVQQSRALQFEHRKAVDGRDMDEILYRLVRNNGWVIQRYAPIRLRDRLNANMIERYENISQRESAVSGFIRGLQELESTLSYQPRRTLSPILWDRFTGVQAVHSRLSSLLHDQLTSKVNIIGPSEAKGREVVDQVVSNLGCELVDTQGEGTAQIIGSISPGPMLDLLVEHPEAITPWVMGSDSAICT